MDRITRKWISLLLSLLLVFSAVSGMAEEKDEVRNWLDMAENALLQEDYRTASLYYTLAATRGNADAQYNLGAMYANGAGVIQSWEKAAEYYQLAAEQGDAAALFNLGSM